MNNTSVQHKVSVISIVFVAQLLGLHVWNNNIAAMGTLWLTLLWEHCSFHFYGGLRQSLMGALMSLIWGMMVATFTECCCHCSTATGIITVVWALTLSVIKTS